MKENVIQSKAFQFSLLIIELYKKLIIEKEFILSKQLLRSATSIGANIEEANAGISKKEFISKLSISSKEARETRYWLRLYQESNLTSIIVEKELEAVEEIIRILTAIVKTSQTKQKESI
jgi:four helix bundle protein